MNRWQLSVVWVLVVGGLAACSTPVERDTGSVRRADSEGVGGQAQEGEVVKTGAEGFSPRVAVKGEAADAKSGAVVLVGAGRVPVYVKGMNNWSNDQHGKTVGLEGRVVYREFLPVATQDADGSWSQGASGSGATWVLEDAKVLERPTEPEALPFGLTKAAWPDHASCLSAVEEALRAGGESPEDFRVGVSIEARGAEVAVPLWHRDAFLPENRDLMGNPGGRCKNAVCDASTGAFVRFLFWQ